MLAHSLAFAPARAYRHLLWLAVAGLLIPLFLVALPPIVRRDQAAPSAQDYPAARTSPAPAAPMAQQLPPGLGPILNATLAADSAADYAPVALDASPGALRADNAAQRFATTFGAGGVSVAPAGGTAFSMHAAAIITDSGTIALPAAQPIVATGRVEYRREGLTEWYVNGPRGLEQGFTLAAPPTGAEQFTIALPVTGSAPVPDGDAVTLGGLRYGGLTVTDAAGGTLPARLDTADGEIRIAVDARGAQWPVIVDPTITSATLVAADGSTSDFFGGSVATATANGTTTIVVGAMYRNTNQGAAYVFVGSAGTYAQQARLIATDSVSGDQFGLSAAVSIAGGTTTIVVGTAASKAYVFTGSSGGTYTQQATLTARDGHVGDSFGRSVAAVMIGTTATIAVGANHHDSATNAAQGEAYLFAGSGSAYPLQTTLTDSGGNAYELFGYSVALASGGGVNTLVVGAPGKDVGPNSQQGQAFIYTGSGTTYSGIAKSASDGASFSSFGLSVAVAVSGGTNTVIVGAPDNNNFPLRGAAYVFVGSGSAYTQTKLTDGTGVNNENFGFAVAVGFGDGGATVVAVGVPYKKYNAQAGNPNDGVFLFTKRGASYTQSTLPESGGNISDAYGYSVAMVIAANGDATVVGGAAGTGNGSVAVSFFSTILPPASIQAVFGNRTQVLKSPAGTFSGAPFHLVAGIVDGYGAPLPGTGVTFTINAAGGVGGRFIAADPNSTTLPVTTKDGTNGTNAGMTDTINLYPASAAGQFTVTATATVDGTALSATYTLTILASLPTPTINAVLPAPATTAAKQGPQTNATTAQPAGLIPPMIIIDPNQSYNIFVNGSGFVKQSYVSQTNPPNPYEHIAAFFTRNPLSAQYPSVAMYVVFISATQLLVTVDGATMLAGLSAATTANINVYNPESSPGANDRGISNPVLLTLSLPSPAPSGSTLSSSGATSVIAAPGLALVLPPVQVVDAQGHPLLGSVDGKAPSLTQPNGGELVASGGGNLVASGGGNLVASGGGNLVASGGGNVISNDGGKLVASGGGNIAQKGGAQPSSAVAAGSSGNVGSAPIRTAAANPSVTSDYIASTDANSIIMAPPVFSNGIPGTFTRTLAVDGINGGVTYTITNLNPHDGHPTTITSLSRTAASTGDPAFILTVTGTGFITTNGGSVLSYGGVQLVTTVDSPTQLHATVPADLLKYSGALGVLVINPDPNGGASLPATFTVTHATTMTLAGLSPNSIAPNGPAFTLTATGTNFVNGATVEWNSTPLTTTFVSATSLTATVPAALTAHGGAAQVTVADPLGGATAALAFTVLTPNALPPPQPGGGPTGGPSPLPGSRQPAGSPLGNPNPLPPSR